MSSDNSIAKFIIVTYQPSGASPPFYHPDVLLVLFPDHIFLTPAKSILVGTRLTSCIWRSYLQVDTIN